MEFVIINANEEATDACSFWSNEFGWTGLDEATRFDEQDIHSVNLPMDGMWALPTEKS